LMIVEAFNKNRRIANYLIKATEPCAVLWKRSEQLLVSLRLLKSQVEPNGMVWLK